MTSLQIAIALILLSAFTHALISALMKRAENKFIFRGILGLISSLIALPLTLFVPPLPTAIWGVLALSLVIHWTYHLLWCAAFTRGDMSLTYPLMRGMSPTLAALFAFLFLDEALNLQAGLGLAIAISALIGFGWTREASRGIGTNISAICLALLCGVASAAFTVLDTYGMRETPVRFSFVVWIFALEGLGIALIMGWLNRDKLWLKIKADWKPSALSSGFSFFTYGSALYAFSLAPVAQMSALRETSVIFGALFAMFWLKEPFGQRRLILSAIMVTGLLIMNTA